jgi:ssDNA-binding Zn-finger/Zn-ribbon topoisomerase 1
LSRKKRTGKKPAKATGAEKAGARGNYGGESRSHQPANPEKSKSNVAVLPWVLMIAVLAGVTIATRIHRLWQRNNSAPASNQGESANSSQMGIGGSKQSPRIARKSPPESGANFVGTAECKSCHRHEDAQWQGSHHQLAMQPATDATVLGDFKNANLVNNGVTSTFSRSGAKFMMRTDGPDGKLHDYEINYTFGVYPLQQYLIAMPGGRLQALGIAWDSRPHERGGQRWFFLHPGEKVPHQDPRHWTAIDQTWNYQCADCHSTNLRKNYDLKTRTYATTYKEMNVACEACHGPGSNHSAWAKKQGDWKRFDQDHGLTIALNERAGATWSIDAATGNPRRSVPRTSEREIQMCARCHSRRGEIHEDYVHGQPIGDDYRVALLDEDLYFPDGQIKGEDYEYGSFIQSKMFHEGVTCSDCHEPHSLKLRAEGNNVCLQCHYAPKYDSTKHHFHQMGTAAARCVECHMPARTYMVVDARRDHSIRIPRPDLSVKLGTPNACTNCHSNRPAQWAADSVYKWYGQAPKGFQRFAETLHAGSIGAPGAEQSLDALIMDRVQPAIARATALASLAAFAPSPDSAAVRIGVMDKSALVRRGSTRALTNSDPRASAVTLAPLLHDPVRVVRLEAAELLEGAPPDVLPSGVGPELEAAIAEYIASQELNADRPESHMNLGLLDEKERHFDEAEGEFKVALSLDPTFAPAAVDLADLYREENRDQDGERVLKGAIDRSPNDASLQHALGLLMIRQKRGAPALGYLGAAARLAPDNARYDYVYAVALNDLGEMNAAIETLEGIVSAHPYDRDSLSALVSFLEQSGKATEALNYAQRLEELEPANSQVAQTVKTLNEEIRAKAK